MERFHDIFEKEYFDRHIEDLYQQALKKIEGGKLYGITINLTNSKEVIAALYVLCIMNDQFKEIAKRNPNELYTT